MRKLLIALAILAASTGCAAAPEEPPASKSPDNPAPDFTVTTFEGDVFSLAEQRGTPVVLNFWESW